MALFEPIYRATVFGPDDLTPLTPRAGSIHSDEFKVATMNGVVGFQPYLGIVDGRRGGIDALNRTTDTGQLTITLLDSRNTVGGLNSERWATAFVGDDEGRQQLLGRLVLVEESLDDGGGWSDFFTGRIQEPATRERLWMDFRLRDLAEELNAPIFTGRPHGNVTYASSAPLVPLGLHRTFGNFPVVDAIPGIVDAWASTQAGTGTRILTDRTAAAGVPKEEKTNIVTKALDDLLLDFSTIDLSESSIAIPGQNIHSKILVEVEITSGARSGEKGLMRLALHPIIDTGIFALGFRARFVSTEPEADGHRHVQSLGIEPLDGTDPDFMAQIADGTTVNYRLLFNGRPTKALPFIVDDVHPVQLWKDILLGYFGLLDTDGSPLEGVSIDTPAFDALIADTTFPTARFLIEKPPERNKWIEDHICKPYNLAYYLNGSGEVVPVDMRPPTTLAGVPTIVADDIDVGSPPRWSPDKSAAITSILVQHYADRLLPTEEIVAETSEFPDVSPIRIESQEHEIELLNIGNPALINEQQHKIEAIGFRSTEDETIDGISRLEYNRRKLTELIQQLRAPFGDGLTTISIDARRVTSQVTTVKPGDYRIIDVDELPDAATNLRGGPRVAQCLEVGERGRIASLYLMDLGANTVAVAPTLGVLSLVSGRTREAVRVPVTINAQGEPAVVWFAVTDTGVGTRPAEGSSLWHFGGLTLVTGDVDIGNIPSNSKVWVRGRTEPGPEKAPKLPSGWVFPAIDNISTSAVAAPSAITPVAIGGSEAEFTFTPGDTQLPTEVWLTDGGPDVHIETLVAGSTRVFLTNLSQSTNYTLKLRHRDPHLGFSPFGTFAFTTSGTALQAPTPLGIEILVGEPG